MTEHLGFLTVLDHPRLGLIGGFLILNAMGRPLEFHCTTPVKANRAQEILYGNTLEPYLYGEQIARTLISRAKTPVGFVVTNVAPVLTAQDCIEQDILYVFGAARKLQPTPDEAAENVQDQTESDDGPDGATNFEISEELNASLKSFGIEKARLQKEGETTAKEYVLPELPGFSLERWKEFKIGNRHIALPGKDEDGRNRLLTLVKELSRTLDFVEPFTRIRLAIEEAQRAA